MSTQHAKFEDFRLLLSQYRQSIQEGSLMVQEGRGFCCFERQPKGHWEWYFTTDYGRADEGTAPTLLAAWADTQNMRLREA